MAWPLVKGVAVCRCQVTSMSFTAVTVNAARVFVYLKLYLRQPSQQQLHLLNLLAAKQHAYFSALGLIAAKLHKPGSETDERQVMPLHA
jgi:hypothetical protein